MSVDASAQIHPSAVIEPGALIGPECRIGPFCVIGPEVVLGRGVELQSHVVVQGATEIGDETVVFPFASLGQIPQDLKFKGEKTRLVIGKRNRIREYVTMNSGTEGGGGITRVGDDGLFMSSCHVAHDAQIGDRVILVNSVAIAGHCVLEDDVIVGGLSGVHQWVRIGRGAIIGALSMVTADVIPHALVAGPRAGLEGLNLVGLKRRGTSREEISALRKTMAALSEGSFRESARKLSDEGVEGDLAREVLDFILGPSDRSFLTPSK
ncbi:MAG: acyl-ACP--UDP-N-acetylglucosamine O-acyltransferase [Thioclava marina]|uniref:acyl-ACP--UDP-N-acetylglucosamine O-acyltransferase n=1 Tax=Thioclava TaxID=285107 RepID=UPI000997CAE8|nr:MULTISPECIES: acyl-ACP--UDP-N-acetylglucosamine O-acyltransferase [Thioclava]MBC7144108.1 acyl-ACP--UDP-N-acetylglucosamine O-acyltransferase [Thioclava marina]OOY28564.1 acyl-[acyl-carrier-protein]--UDP-N-acetylglucosamine O-acyltransferase [Thioclava sp. L04-15]TNE85364.1 MAG: acyl-ACP--UDP-N-acetylglucosamine O-acyltransferase [Paracoccaceae bacterium]